ncbi:MAG: lysoplasmalogenase [Spirochaetaceae bacterium]|jgi:uncharacterized membrane protein YhhN|nr:lysoplasmalogenase [Spirochaetaceae bacterium]
MLLLLPFILVSCIHFFAILFSFEKLPQKISKVFLLPCLFLFYVLTANPVRPIVCAAICCGWLGDILLLRRKDMQMPFLIPGVIFFFAENLIYSLIFYNLISGSKYFVFIFAIVSSTITWFILRKYTKIDIRLRNVSALYGIALSAMLVSAIYLCVGNLSPIYITLLIGAALFITSDITLATVSFPHQTKWNTLFVMFTYCIAQLLIIFSLSNLS